MVLSLPSSAEETCAESINCGREIRGNRVSLVATRPSNNIRQRRLLRLPTMTGGAEGSLEALLEV